jgi:hypothetical protein
MPHYPHTCPSQGLGIYEAGGHLWRPGKEPQQLRQLGMRRAWRDGPGQSDRSVRPVELASVSDVDGFRLATSSCSFEPLNAPAPPLSGGDPPPGGGAGSVTLTSIAA